MHCTSSTVLTNKIGLGIRGLVLYPQKDFLLHCFLTIYLALLEESNKAIFIFEMTLGLLHFG